VNIVREAARRLPGHWYQGDVSDHKDNYCGIGHVFEASKEVLGVIDMDAVGVALRAMDAVAVEQYPERVKAVMRDFASFNDHPDTTEAEVIAVMEKAAVRLDEQV
jgi:hypothetical protein